RFPALALEGAELTVHEANVGEVDVAVDDVGDLIADVRGTDGVGRAHQRDQVVALDAEQQLAAGDAELLARQGGVEERPDGRAGGGDCPIDGVVVQGDGLDGVPGIEPAHAGDASSAAGAALRASAASAVTCGLSAGASQPGSSM